MEVKDYNGDEAQQQYEGIPEDRVFYTLKLFLTEDNMIGGAGLYDGPALKQMGAGPILAVQAEIVGNWVTNAAQKAIQRVGAVIEVGAILNEVFAAAKEEQRDGKDSEQVGGGSATSAQ